MNTPSPSRWKELLEACFSIIDSASASGIKDTEWSFGGGTALMNHIGHRESHDIDIFITDPQYLPFLNPEPQSYSLNLDPVCYETDGSGFLKIIFNGIGEIDFICCNPVTKNPFQEMEFLGRKILVETPVEIITKKIVFRGKNFQPRDMFDLSATLKVMGADYISSALHNYKNQCSAALDVVERMDKDLALITMQKLNALEGFKEDFLTAQQNCSIFLKSILYDKT